MIVYFNGTFGPKDEVRISPDDRGFLFGDGVYEVARTYGGRLFTLDRHLDRLRYSLREMRIQGVDVDGLGSVFRELVKRNDLGSRDAMVYFQATRGAAIRTHAFPNPPAKPTVYAYAAPIVSKFDPATGVGAITVPDNRWARCDIKSVSLLPNCMANNQAVEAGVFEAIFIRDGVALEGSHTSMFAVVDGILRTAPLTNYVLPGITRDLVLELCAANAIPVRQRPIFLPELQRAEEVFLAGTTTEVLPVIQIDGKPVAGGKPGPTTNRLRELFRTFATRNLE